MNLALSSRRSAKILILTAFTLAAIGLMLLAYLRLGMLNNVLTGRSQSWNAALPVAEAGIEEALAYLNYMKFAGKLNNLEMYWAKSKGNYVKQRTLNPEARYEVSLEKLGGNQYKITSVGYLKPILGSTEIQRSITTTATKANTIFTKALVAKKHIRAGKGTLMDSFDSTLGPYHPATRMDTADVAATSTKKNAVKVDRTKIYGTGATSPKGNFEFKNSGVLGDKPWVDGGNVGPQADKIADDFTFDFPEVRLPALGWSPLAKNPGKFVATVNGVTTNWNCDYRLGNQAYTVGKLDLTGPLAVTNGTATLYVTGDFIADQDIIVGPNAQLVIYMGGHRFEVKGRNITVNNNDPTAFQYFGLKENKDVRIKKNSTMAAVIYAPRAKIKIEGAADFFGSVVGKCVHFKHDGQFHYDEGLDKKGTELDLFCLTSWVEY